MTAAPERAESTLVRAIGVRGLTASIINVTIGAGIFVLPATVAAGLGTGAPAAYLACAALMLLVVLCVAAAGSRVSLTGGLYAYTEVAFGGLIGFFSGLLYTLSAIFSVASVASAFAGSIGVVVPLAATGAGRALVIVLLFGALAAVNIRGAVGGVRVVEGATLVKIVPLLLLVGAGVWFVRPEYLGWPTIPAMPALGRTAVVLVFAFVGAEVALVPSGEFVNPSRTVPIALFSALAVTTALYLALQAVAQGLLGPALGTYTAAPLAEAAGRVFGRSGRLIVLAGATVSMFGYVSGDMLGSPRNLFAFARGGLLPAALARVHPRFRTPHLAIAAHAGVVTALAISSSFVQLAVIANVASLSQYLLCVAAAYELQRRDVRAGGAPFVLPGGPLIPALAAAVIVWLLAQATWREVAVETVVLASAAAFYALRRGAATLERSAIT